MAGLMEAVGAAEKVFELIDRQPEIDHHSGSEKPDKLDGVVEFRNVSFSYPTRPNVQVLKDVSFTVQPGEMVALVGKYNIICYVDFLVMIIIIIVCLDITF